VQEPIFGRGALPNEQKRFQLIDDDFRAIMRDVKRDDRVVSMCARPGLKERLPQMADQLARCQKSLNEFLEQKRSVFPRFYFIGDDDLLEILGQATNPLVIQNHLKKLFAGIHTVGFNDKTTAITEMHSQEGEVVKLLKPVSVSANVEQWLGDLADEMRHTLEDQLSACVKAVHIHTKKKTK
jgi:dynein heavy chain 2